MLRAGDQVGNYEIEALLGAGGMASVFRARHTTLGSEHAIKVLNADLAQDPAVRERFVQEGRVLAQVRHPGLVRVTEVVTEGVAGLVMDLLDGEDLASRLRAGPLSAEVAAGIMLQALSAVGHAHAAGVVHRDLKPANLFLVHRPGRLPLVKVLDFGIAKLRGLEQTRGVQALGTVAYMSPEQIEAPAKVDARSDLFSLGVVLFEMVAGEPPFSGDTDFAVMQSIVEGRPAVVADAAGVLAPVVRRALQTRPEDRFPDAASFAETLRSLAPVDIRHMVAEWEEQAAPSTRDLELSHPGGPAPATSARSRSGDAPPPPPPSVAQPAPSERPLAPPPGAPALPERAARALDEALERSTTRSIVRWVGLLQLASGMVNVLFMSALQFLNVAWCPIFGLPAAFGLLLLVVGLVEVLTGLAALATGSRGSVRRVAQLEVLSIAGGGIFSGLVGMYVLSLRRRYPGILP